MKRWTVNARDILPGDLVLYQKDHALPAHNTFRHQTLYVKALEVVQLGDSNAESYEVAMQGFEKLGCTHMPYKEFQDGTGLLYKKNTLDQRNATVTDKQSTDHEVTATTHSDEPIHILAPAKNVGSGCPTSTRSRPPYEKSAQRSKFYTVCREKGHTCATCPQRAHLPKQPRKAPMCSTCNIVGRKTNQCTSLAAKLGNSM